jgi:hypothetical protein
MNVILNEEEKNEISSQDGEIDSRIFNFLMRRIQKNKRNLGNNEFDDDIFEVTEYTFEGFPRFGFNTFNNKKQIERKIIEMLVEETDLVGDWFFGPENVNNPERQKFMRTIRKFLNFILTD